MNDSFSKYDVPSQQGAALALRSPMSGIPLEALKKTSQPSSFSKTPAASTSRKALFLSPTGSHLPEDMSDPLSIAASLLAVTTAAIASAKSLRDTVKRYRERNKTLGRLEDGLSELIRILDSLSKVSDTEESMLELLRSPVDRCSQVCREFEESMKVFGGESKIGFRDWTRMEFMRGDINEFIDTVAGYKSTISVALGVINL